MSEVIGNPPPPQTVTQRLRETVVSRAKTVETVTQRVMQNVIGARPTAERRVIRAAGALQGSPGPRQIYNQALAPAAISGYTLLWFKSGVSADPDDRELLLVE